MGQSAATDTFKSQAGQTPRAAKIFTRPILGASQVFKADGLGLRIKADPEVIALVAPNLSAQLVVDGNTAADFPVIEAGAVAPPPPPPASPDPSPDDIDAPTPTPQPAPPVDMPVDVGVPEGLEDPFAGQGRARFSNTHAEMRGTQSYCVVLSFTDALWSALGERTFEVVAYLVGERRMIGG